MCAFNEKKICKGIQKKIFFKIWRQQLAGFDFDGHFKMILNLFAQFQGILGKPYDIRESKFMIFIHFYISHFLHLDCQKNHKQQPFKISLLHFMLLKTSQDQRSRWMGGFIVETF